MKVSVLINERPQSKEWNELYYMLEGSVTIADDDGATILYEQSVQVIELDESAKKWETKGLKQGLPFLYAPDSYELNPMLEIAPVGSAWRLSGMTPEGRRSCLADTYEVQKMLYELHRQVKDAVAL
jgi:hypothetical protein